MTNHLADTQIWMYSAMTGIVPPADADGMVRSAGSLSARERVELYRRTYTHRLTGCMRETFPALRHALGDELFDDFVHDYLSVHPPKSPSLSTLGDDFPGFLEATRPDGDRPADQRESWPNFLVDLARLELAFHEVFDGPGTEFQPMPTAPDIPSGSEELPAVTVVPAPCVRLLPASHPVDEYLLAVRRGHRPPLPRPRQGWIVVTRRNWVVVLLALEPAEGELFRRLVQGSDLGTAAAGAGFDPGTAAQMVAGWADRGLFSQVRVLSTKGAAK